MRSSPATWRLGGTGHVSINVIVNNLLNTVNYAAVNTNVNSANFRVGHVRQRPADGSREPAVPVLGATTMRTSFRLVDHRRLIVAVFALSVLVVLPLPVPTETALVAADGCPEDVPHAPSTSFVSTSSFATRTATS